ncbi:sodium-dependent transporter, partial [bacterium]|nr:sodium-dependent transporter [bacterium]
DFLIKYFTPAILILTFSMDLFRTITEPYGGYPNWALFAGGWGVVALVFVLSFVFMRIRANNKEALAAPEGGGAGE